MRYIEDVIEEYNDNKKSGRKKITIIRWFAKYPGKRFDINEVHSALGDELDIGEGQIYIYLTELTDEGVLESYGGKRKAYHLANDITPPVRYQALAGLRHLVAVFDIDRWGIMGILVIVPVIWAMLTFPLWFFWGTLVISPTDSYGSISQSDFFRIALAMTLWLIGLIFASAILFRTHRWRKQR